MYIYIYYNSNELCTDAHHHLKSCAVARLGVPMLGVELHPSPLGQVSHIHVCRPPPSSISGAIKPPRPFRNGKLLLAVHCFCRAIVM